MQGESAANQTKPPPPGTADSAWNTSKPGRVNDPGSMSVTLSRISREDRESWSADHPFRTSFAIRRSLRGLMGKEQQIRRFVYRVGWTFLPVRGGWIAVRDARYHNGVFQPRGHINHLLVYHRRHGAAYLCNQKKPRTDKSCNDSEDGNDTRETIEKYIYIYISEPASPMAGKDKISNEILVKFHGEDGDNFSRYSVPWRNKASSFDSALHTEGSQVGPSFSSRRAREIYSCRGEDVKREGTRMVLMLRTEGPRRSSLIKRRGEEG